MDIYYRVCILAPKPEQWAAADAFGIEDFEFGRDDALAFSIAESNPRFAEVETWALEHDLIWNGTIRFTDAETDAARWVSVRANWNHGYPQPEDGFGRTVVYEEAPETVHCTGRAWMPFGSIGSCGINEATRVAPWRLRGEPKWGRRGAMSPFWVHDTFFVKPEVWEEVFRPFGIDCGPVLHKNGKDVLKTVVELRPQERVAMEAPVGLPIYTCPYCHRSKYHRPKAQLPAITNPTGSHYVEGDLWLGGEGAGAVRPQVFSRELRLAVEAASVRGLTWEPITDPDW